MCVLFFLYTGTLTTTLAQFVPFLDVALAAFGPDRCLIGSDWPVCLAVGSSYGSTLRLVRDYLIMRGLTGEQQDGILGGNCARVYGLK